MTSADSRSQAGSVNNYVLNLLLLLTLLGCNQTISASESTLRINADIGAVITIEGEGSILWIGTSEGLFRWDDAPKGGAQKFLADSADIDTVHVLLRDSDTNTLWIGSKKGLFRWNNPRQGRPQFITDKTGPIDKLYKLNQTLLIGAKNGLFIWQNVDVGRPTRIDLDVSHVNAFCRDSNNKLWIGSEKGLLLYDGGDKKPVFLPEVKDVNVTSLYKDGSTLLIGTPKGLLRWDDVKGGRPDWVLAGAEVHSLHKDVSTLLISANGKGLLRWNNIREGQPELIDNEIGTSSKYCRSGSILWMGAGVVTEAGLYRWDSQTEKKPQRIDKINTGFVFCFYKSGDTLWIGADKGLFRLNGLDTDWDAKLQITSELPKIIYTDHNLLIRWHVGNFGGRTTPEQAQYRVIVKNAGGREVRPGGWEVSGLQEYTLPRLEDGKYSLYIQATDLNGKVALSPPIQFLVYSSWQDVLFGRLKKVGIIYGALILLAIIFAPFSNFCHDLLMNPWVRKFGSFGIIPLALTVFPPVRRHILKRYFRGVKNDKEFSRWQARFVIPTENFLPDSYGALLEDKRRLLLLGQSGIGKTSYFKYLTGYYARRGNTPPVGAIPVFLPIIRYQGELPENMFSAQLASYGRLADKKLNNWFLQEGGFLIFIDGLNEVDESTRNKINTFVDQHWKANYFCLSSQHAYPEFAGIERIQLASLNEDKIKEFLQQRLGDKQAQAIIKQFDENISDIYKIPQDLELAVEYKDSNPSLPIPRSKMELYEATLSPILTAWVAEGRTGYSDLLFHRAYEMLRSREPFFDDSDTSIPDDLRDCLVEKKYLTRRSDHYMFRHDLIRSYLASKYFSHRWRPLLSDLDLEIDNDWRPMLEFFLLNLKQPDEAREMLERILVKNKQLAGELFSWMKVTTPSICSEWATDFKLKFADAMLIST